MRVREIKNYRVKGVDGGPFIVQKRYLIFFWITYSERNNLYYKDKVFSKKEDALLYAKQKKEGDLNRVNNKYIQYV